MDLNRIPFALAVLAALAVSTGPARSDCAYPAGSGAAQRGAMFLLEAEPAGNAGDITAPAMAATAEVIAKRLAGFELSGPAVVRPLGTSGIVVHVPGIDPDAGLLNVIWRTGALRFHAVIEDGGTGTATGPDQVVARDIEGDDSYGLRREAVLTGDHITGGETRFGMQTGSLAMLISLSPEGARILGDYSAAHIGELLAVVVDDHVLLSPRIMAPMTGGEMIIEGNFSPETATELSILLSAGPLPVPLSVAERRVAGPVIHNGAFTGDALILHLDLTAAFDPDAACARLSGLGFGDIALQRAGDRRSMKLLAWVEAPAARPDGAAIADALAGFADLRRIDSVGPNAAAVPKGLLGGLQDWLSGAGRRKRE